MSGPVEMSKFDVFISYSSNDKTIADAVVAAHEKAGIRCWYAPRDIKPGADWAESITKAIQDSSLMVLVFSEMANRSQRVLDEINFAIDHGKPILPFRIEPHNPTGAFSLHLSSRHWLDAYEPGWNAHIARLVESVKVNLGTQDDSIRISGGAASAVVSREQTQTRQRKAGLIIGGLAGVIILGVLGWQLMGGQASPEPTITSPAASSLTPTDAPTATEETLPAATPTPDYSAIMQIPLVVREDITTLDPHNAGNATLEITKNLFLSLTRFNPETAEVLPAAAASWSISPDGMIYTFTLHPDIPWVQHALGGETVQANDEEGNPRFLTAADFQFAFQRICDPRANIYYAEIIDNILGCMQAREYHDPENIPSEVLDAIGVEAVSATELIIKLIEPSASFLTRTTTPNLVAVPSWAIEKYGEAWTNPGIMPSYGPFVIDQWVTGENVKLVRNQLMPESLQRGNLGVVDMTIVSSPDISYQYWLAGLVDYSEVPIDLQEDHLAQYKGQTFAYNSQVVHYAVFNHGNETFSNLYLRRAFSAALDRVQFLEDIIQIGGIPMIHLAPPGVFGAPAVDQIGVGYDPEYAQNALSLAGFPGCEGIPQINFYAYSGIADVHNQEISRYWEDALGCPEGVINYRGAIFDMTAAGEDWSDWDIIITGWGSDFPDQENWVGTMLSCENENFLGSNRQCTEVDDLIAQARVETTPSDRRELYWEIEEAFFGEDGSFPIAPLYTPYQYFAVREWVSLVQPTTFEGFDLAGSRLDMNAKMNE